MADNFQITQGSGTFIATDQAGSGEHYQRVKLVEATLDSTSPTGVTSNPLKVDGSGATQPVSGTVAISNFPSFGTISTLCISTTGIAGAAVTATLPAVSGQFHVVTAIEIVRFSTANTSGAVPTVITSTNLPGSLAFTIDIVGSTGQSLERYYPDLNLKSSVVNTVTTIVCPATTNIIWRVNVFYYTTT